MERNRRKRHRLLTFGCSLVFLFGLISPAVSESESQELPQVLLETESTLLTVALPWKITLLIQYPKPEDVRMSLPPIPSALELDRVRTGVRIVETQPWTVVEYTFIPKRPTSLMLGPFEIQIPGKRLFSSPQALTIQDAQGQETECKPRLYWTGPADRAQVGSPMVYELRLEGCDKEITTLSVNLVQNALVEPLPLSDQDRTEGILYRIRCTPLSSGNLYLPEASLVLDKDSISSEPKQIVVAEGQIRKKETTQSIQVVREAPGNKNRMHTQKEVPPFPEYKKNVTWMLFWSLPLVLQENTALWEHGDYAKALANLRRNERDSLASPIYRRIRKDAERQLGILSSPDEWWIPQKALWVLSVLALGLALLFGVQKRRRLRILILACTIVILIYSLVGQAVLVPLLRGGSIGLVGEQEIVAYTIPDTAGSISTHFTIGEAVLMQQRADTWVFVSTYDQRSGWMLRSSIIMY